MKKFNPATLVVAILLALVASITLIRTTSAAQADCDQNWVTMCCDNTNQHYSDRNCDTFRRDHLTCCVAPPDDDTCKLPNGVGYCSQKEPVCNIIVDKDKVGTCPTDLKLTDADIAKIVLALQKVIPQDTEPPASFFNVICPQILKGGETYHHSKRTKQVWNCMHIYPSLAVNAKGHKDRQVQEKTLYGTCDDLIAMCLAHQGSSPSGALLDLR